MKNLISSSILAWTLATAGTAEAAPVIDPTASYYVSGVVNGAPNVGGTATFDLYNSQTWVLITWVTGSVASFLDLSGPYDIRMLSGDGNEYSLDLSNYNSINNIFKIDWKDWQQYDGISFINSQGQPNYEFSPTSISLPSRLNPMNISAPVWAVPEPETLALLLGGLWAVAGVTAMRRRKEDAGTAEGADESTTPTV